MRACARASTTSDGKLEFVVSGCAVLRSLPASKLHNEFLVLAVEHGSGGTTAMCRRCKQRHRPPLDVSCLTSYTGILPFAQVSAFKVHDAGPDGAKNVHSSD